MKPPVCYHNNEAFVFGNMKPLLTGPTTSTKHRNKCEYSIWARARRGLLGVFGKRSARKDLASSTGETLPVDALGSILQRCDDISQRVETLQRAYEQVSRSETIKSSPVNSDDRGDHQGTSNHSQSSQEDLLDKSERSIPQTVGIDALPMTPADDAACAGLASLCRQHPVSRESTKSRVEAAVSCHRSTCHQRESGFPTASCGTANRTVSESLGTRTIQIHREVRLIVLSVLQELMESNAGDTRKIRAALHALECGDSVGQPGCTSALRGCGEPGAGNVAADNNLPVASWCTCRSAEAYQWLNADSCDTLANVNSSEFSAATAAWGCDDNDDGDVNDNNNNNNNRHLHLYDKPESGDNGFAPSSAPIISAAGKRMLCPLLARGQGSASARSLNQSSNHSSTRPECTSGNRIKESSGAFSTSTGSTTSPVTIVCAPKPNGCRGGEPSQHKHASKEVPKTNRLRRRQRQRQGGQQQQHQHCEQRQQRPEASSHTAVPSGPAVQPAGNERCSRRKVEHDHPQLHYREAFLRAYDAPSWCSSCTCNSCTSITVECSRDNGG